MLLLSILYFLSLKLLVIISFISFSLIKVLFCLFKGLSISFMPISPVIYCLIILFAIVPLLGNLFELLNMPKLLVCIDLSLRLLNLAFLANSKEPGKNLLSLLFNSFFEVFFMIFMLSSKVFNKLSFSFMFFISFSLFSNFISTPLLKSFNKSNSSSNLSNFSPLAIKSSLISLLISLNL